MKTKKRSIWIVVGIICAFVLLALFGLGKDIKGLQNMRLGIDIRGGVEAVFEPEGVQKAPTKSQLEIARNVIESRLDAKNILDREVTVDQKSGNIIVRFPWKSDEKDFNPEQAILELGETAKLTFQNENGDVLLEGQEVTNSTVQRDSKTNEYVVALTFNKKGTKDFAQATEEQLGKKIGIYMDDELISNPVVQDKIEGGEAVINGMSSSDEAKALSEKINAGSLPFSLKTTNYNTISPTLGNYALRAMVMAGILAFILVCLFMIVYYKLPGIISCMTLILQMSLQLLALSVPQFTLTLPGIAGLILSLGMAVDANVITSERISEELKSTKSIKTAVKKGYAHAFSSVIDGNITSAIVAIILMIFGSGTMLSFGYTLLTGVLINIGVGVFVSRKMLQSIILYPKFNQNKMFRQKKEKKIIAFSHKRKLIFGLTASVLTIGLIISFTNGIRLDTQFTGGVILKYNYEGNVDSSSIDNKVEEILGRPTNVQLSEDGVTGNKKLVLTLAGNQGIDPGDQQKVGEELNKLSDAKYELAETYVVEPYIGAKALHNSILAIVLSAVFIVIYVWIRFKVLSGLSAGISAIIALLHDVLMVFIVFGVFKIPLNDAFVAVTLTIIGYSINDTIVLYDRIRENIRNSKKKWVPGELVDISITETLGRTINTAFTTVMCILIVCIFALVYGIDSIIVFAVPMLVGMVCGCYSTICIAGPIWSIWKDHKGKGK